MPLCASEYLHWREIIYRKVRFCKANRRGMSTDNRNVPLFKTIEMSPFVVVGHFYFPVVVEAVRKVEIRGVCGFPSAVGKSVLWTFPRSVFSTAFRRRASSDCFFGCRQFVPTSLIG